jgi:hypothetical protein
MEICLDVQTKEPANDKDTINKKIMPAMKASSNTEALTPERKAQQELWNPRTRSRSHHWRMPNWLSALDFHLDQRDRRIKGAAFSKCTGLSDLDSQ